MKAVWLGLGLVGLIVSLVGLTLLGAWGDGERDGDRR